MAAFSPPSGNVYGDFLKYIFPAVVAVALFVPLFAPSTTAVDGVLIGGVILGYLTADVLSELATYVAKSVWPYRRTYGVLREERQYLRENWDVLRVAYAMAKDDREYFEHSSRKAEFYKLASFYLYAYFFTNLLFGILYYLFDTPFNPLSTRDKPPGWLETPMLGKWQCPTWILLLVSFGLAHKIFGRYLLEYQYLFGYDGHSERVGASLFSADPDVAVHLWGRVLSQGKAVPGLIVRLQAPTVSVVEVHTDQQGRFRFENAMRKYRNQKLSLNIVEPWKLYDSVVWAGVVDLSATTLPRLRIELPEEA